MVGSAFDGNYHGIDVQLIVALSDLCAFYRERKSADVLSGLVTQDRKDAINLKITICCVARHLFSDLGRLLHPKS